MTDYPLVSCVMPTANRPRFVEHAVKQFMAQDYPNKELLILGDVDITRNATDAPLVWRFNGSDGVSLGTKRNTVNDLARGEYIMHWDDDDWFSKTRISYQVAEMKRTGAEISGLSSMLYYDLRNDKQWWYEYQGTRPWLAGGSLCYRKEFWERSPFPDKQIGSDTDFVWAQSLENSVTLSDIGCYVATIHNGNTSPKQTFPPLWQSWKGVLPLGVVAMRELVH